MLLIDDEADNASIDVEIEDEKQQKQKMKKGSRHLIIHSLKKMQINLM